MLTHTHGRACPGHPRLWATTELEGRRGCAGQIPGSSPGTRMTKRRMHRLDRKILYLALAAVRRARRFLDQPVAEGRDGRLLRPLPESHDVVGEAGRHAEIER